MGIHEMEDRIRDLETKLERARDQRDAYGREVEWLRASPKGSPLDGVQMAPMRVREIREESFHGKPVWTYYLSPSTHQAHLAYGRGDEEGINSATTSDILMGCRQKIAGLGVGDYFTIDFVPWVRRPEPEDRPEDLLRDALDRLFAGGVRIGYVDETGIHDARTGELLKEWGTSDKPTDGRIPDIPVDPEFEKLLAEEEEIAVSQRRHPTFVEPVHMDTSNIGGEKVDGKTEEAEGAVEAD